MGVFVAGVPSFLAPRTPFFSRVLAPLPLPFTPATQARLRTNTEMQASSFSRSTKDYFIIWPHRLVSRREAFGGYIGEKLGNEACKALWLVLT